MEISEDLKQLGDMLENIKTIEKTIIDKKNEIYELEKPKMIMISCKGLKKIISDKKQDVKDLNELLKKETRNFKTFNKMIKKKGYEDSLKEFYNRDLYVDCSEIDRICISYKCPYCNSIHRHGSNSDLSNRTETRNSHCSIHRGLVYISINDFTIRK